MLPAIVALSGLTLSLTVAMQYRRVVLLRLGKLAGVQEPVTEAFS